MGKVIVADENQGRRTLLASTLEREGFDVTRAGHFAKQKVLRLRSCLR